MCQEALSNKKNSYKTRRVCEKQMFPIMANSTDGHEDQHDKEMHIMQYESSNIHYLMTNINLSKKGQM